MKKLSIFVLGSVAIFSILLPSIDSLATHHSKPKKGAPEIGNQAPKPDKTYDKLVEDTRLYTAQYKSALNRLRDKVSYMNETILRERTLEIERLISRWQRYKESRTRKLFDASWKRADNIRSRLKIIRIHLRNLKSLLERHDNRHQRKRYYE